MDPHSSEAGQAPPLLLRWVMLSSSSSSSFWFLLPIGSWRTLTAWPASGSGVLLSLRYSCTDLSERPCTKALLWHGHCIFQSCNAECFSLFCEVSFILFWLEETAAVHAERWFYKEDSHVTLSRQSVSKFLAMVWQLYLLALKQQEFARWAQGASISCLLPGPRIWLPIGSGHILSLLALMSPGWGLCD